MCQDSAEGDQLRVHAQVVVPHGLPPRPPRGADKEGGLSPASGSRGVFGSAKLTLLDLMLQHKTHPAEGKQQPAAQPGSSGQLGSRPASMELPPSGPSSSTFHPLSASL